MSLSAIAKVVLASIAKAEVSVERGRRQLGGVYVLHSRRKAVYAGPRVDSEACPTASSTNNMAKQHWKGGA